MKVGPRKAQETTYGTADIPLGDNARWPRRPALVTHNGIITEVKKGLERCGYVGGLLREGYSYEDDQGAHTAEIAGFGRPVYDSRTSCVCAVIADDSKQVTPAYVDSFRGLGAPVVFICHRETVGWWSIRTDGAHCEEDAIERKELSSFFDAQKEKFAPERIWRAKNLGRVDEQQQLTFVDIGLMPLLEEEMGERLGGLMKRVIGSLQGGFTQSQLKKPDSQRWVFRAGFWLLCAKILRDKGVNDFVDLDINNVPNTLSAVKTHYGAQLQVEAGTKKQIDALEEAAQKIKEFADLSNLTTEAFGYMYETALVDKKLRAALGIHATPSYLVDYVVWQLWPLIERIPESKRVVLEPACGHAPFLTSAMRMLRFLHEGKGDFHEYARERLVGMECDSFAREIARLSLTMADVPNPNGWKITKGDIYRGDMLSELAREATILLCNPPFENFGPGQKASYSAEGEQLRSSNKAAEMLWRTLPHMPTGSVFGVVLPRGFLHRKNLAELRKMILSDFEFSEICLLPTRVFSKADMKSVVLLGKKTSRKRQSIKYTIVPEGRLDSFKSAYHANTEAVRRRDIEAQSDYDLRITPLQDIWEYCRGFSTLTSVASVGRGIEFKSVSGSTSRTKFAGAVQGFVRFEKTIEDRKGQRNKWPLRTTEVPDLYWMDLSSEAIANPRYGMPAGKSRVLVNYGRTSRDTPWRVTALIDERGRATSNCCMVVAIEEVEWDARVLWAILNSPMSNAFVFCHSMERHNLEGTIRRIPLPNYDGEAFRRVCGLVDDFFSLGQVSQTFLGGDADKKELMHKCLSIDAEVLRLYDLPPRMEKRVLDMFQGVQRKGVDFDFTGYYPEGFESAIPLHEYLSEEYQRSTVSFVEKWVEDNRSAEMNEVFEKALEAFGEH